MYYYYYNKQLLKESTVNNAIGNIEYFQSNVDKILFQCEIISNFIYINRDIDKLLIRDYFGESPKEYYNYNLDINNAQKVLNDRVASSPIRPYIKALIIKGNNNVFLKTGHEADYINVEQLNEQPWFQDNKYNHHLSWGGIQKSISTIATEEFILPIVRPIIFSDNYRTIGWQMIALSPNIIKEALQDYQVPPNNILILFDGQNKCVFSTQPSMVGKNVSDLASNTLNEKYSIKEYNESKWMAVSKKSAYSGFTILQLIAYEEIEKQNFILMKMTLIITLTTLSIATILMLFLSNNLTNPLKRIGKKMSKIAEGDFERDLALEGKDEIGMLGRGINDLAEHVNILLEKVKEEESQKRKLELKALQNQINPHFIYNALNTVKIMASIQGAKGIYDMVTNFGELLKEVSKGVDDKITIEKEFELLDKYIYIQKMRRNGLIRASYEIDEEIKNCTIIKFLLQPLVENAIIHGFETKKGMGCLTIHATSENNNMCIYIKDNGIGIAEEEMNHLFIEKNNNGLIYTNVGIKNTQDRIQLIYGKQYGLSYESKLGEYTSVKITIPKEKKKDEMVGVEA